MKTKPHREALCFTDIRDGDKLVRIHQDADGIWTALSSHGKLVKRIQRDVEPDIEAESIDEGAIPFLRVEKLEDFGSRRHSRLIGRRNDEGSPEYFGVMTLGVPMTKDGPWTDHFVVHFGIAKNILNSQKGVH